MSLMIGLQFFIQNFSFCFEGRDYSFNDKDLILLLNDP
jgi:hypothetical protein